MIDAEPAPARAPREPHAERAASLAYAACLGLIYYALAVIAIKMSLQPEAIANVWFANAAAVVALATVPRSRWGLLLATVAVANFAANVSIRGAPLLSASFLPGNLAEIVAGAWLMARFDLAHRFDDDGSTFIAALAAGGLAPQLLGATIGAAVLHWHGFASFSVAWPVWYIDSTLGTAAIMPLALALRKSRASASWRQLASPLALLLLIVTVGVIFFAFGLLPYAFTVISLPLVASVFFVAPVATFALAFTVVLVVSAGLDFGWLDRRQYAAPWANLFLFLPAAAAVLPAQLLAVVVQRMRRLLADTRALTTIGSDVAAAFDTRGVFRGVNRAYERDFGGTPGALVGRTIEQAVDPLHAATVRARFERVLASGQPVRARDEIDTAQGRRVMEVEYQPLADDRGQASGVLFSAHDVTDLVAVQRVLEQNVAQLRRANEGMEQFVRIASHDMREPLNTVMQFCELIETETASGLSPAARLYLTHVHRGSQRMRTLLDDVLSFVRLEGGSEAPQRSVALAGVLTGVREALASRIAERRARIVITPLPVVVGQESLLALLFLNLLGNGIKFTPSDREPQLHVGSRDDGDFVVITVADHGIGIAATDQRGLFVPFKRLHTRRQYDGTGLGLAICRRVVELMGGSISLESQPGAGTQVHVRLRRAEVLEPKDAVEATV